MNSTRYVVAGELHILVTCPCRSFSAKPEINHLRRCSHYNGNRHGRPRDAQGCPGLAGDFGTSPHILTEGRAGRGVGHLRQPLSRISSGSLASSPIPESSSVTASSRSTGTLNAARLAGAHRGLSRGRRGAVRRAATKALASAGTHASDIDTVVTVSSTGIATPSLEARVARRMGFRSDVARVPVFGLGCAGGVSGLSIASRLAQARPGSNVLLVAVELCTLALRLDELTKANIVATACSATAPPRACCAPAMAARADRDCAASISGRTPSTSWAGRSIPQGFGVIFDRAIPRFRTSATRPRGGADSRPHAA